MQKIVEKIGYHSDDVGPRFNGSMDITKSDITQQSLVRINCNFGTKRQNRFSHSSQKIVVLRLIFWVPDP